MEGKEMVMQKKVLIKLKDLLKCIKTSITEEGEQLLRGSDEALRKLSIRLQKIQANVQEAEAESLNFIVTPSDGSKGMLEWFLDARALLYDIEDFLDRQSPKVLALRKENDRDGAATVNIGTPNSQLQHRRGRSPRVHNKVRKFFRNHLLRQKISSFEKRLEDLRTNSNSSSSESTRRSGDISRQSSGDSISSSFSSDDIDPQQSAEEVEIFGRESEKKEIIELLLEKDEQYRDSVILISIIGAGGLGKTALAKIVCDDDKVKSHFEIIRWVPMGDYDLSSDVSKIAESIIGSSVHMDDYDSRSDVSTDAELIIGNTVHMVDSDYDSRSDGSTNADPIIEFADISTNNLPSSSDNTLDSLQQLKERLRRKRFLIVLDDMWTDIWSKLWDFLQNGARGSRVLVTTRSEVAVARSMGMSMTHLQYYLQPLGDKASWSLFESIAFWERRKSDCSPLEDIGKKIFQKGGGFPLFVKAWGSILLMGDTREEWQHFSENEIWEAAKIGQWQLYPQLNVWKNVLQSLKSGYVRLPRDLKRCLKYCSLFPKGCWIEKDVLIQLWMAEGVTQGAEDTSIDYFEKLVSQTCFFRDVEKDEDGKIFRCKIHEPFHDFVRELSRDEYTLIKDAKEGFNHLGRTRHLSLHWDVDSTRNRRNLCFPTLSCFGGLKKRDGDAKTVNGTKPLSASNLQTLLCFGDPGNQNGNTTMILGNTNSNLHTLLCFGNPKNGKLPNRLFSRLNLLRALDLSSTNIKELSHSINKLKLLRYLNLSYTSVKGLPQSICDLWFLQTLKLSYALLRELPKETGKLVNLKHLEIEGTLINYLPVGIERLTRIQKLSEFIVSDGESGCMLCELRPLRFLQGKLIISYLSRLKSIEDTQKADLANKDQIDWLVLDAKKHFSLRKLGRSTHLASLMLDHIHNEDTQLNSSNETEKMTRMRDVFEGIKPHSNLKKLEIWNYIGSEFPFWMKDASSLTNLTSLKLVKCLKAEHLPQLGKLQRLKFLLICEMDEVKSIGNEFYDEGSSTECFPELLSLVFERMRKLERWEVTREVGDMPKFEELILRDCPSLISLPRFHKKLNKLEIYNCESLSLNPPLPSVEHLVLKYNDYMVNDKQRSLPNIPELKSLKITLSSDLRSFPQGLCKLKALNSLDIHFCPKLRSLPEELNQMTIHRLCIVGCPLLRKIDRSTVSHIADIEIDHVKIQNHN